MKRKILILTGWLLAWQALSIIIHNPIMMAGPFETLCSLKEMLGTALFWESILASFERIAAGFVLGAAAGVLFAVAAGKIRLLRDILSPFVTALKTVPVASFIILALIWAGSGNVSLFISFIVVFPILYLETLSGIDSLDVKLVEMADVYKVPFGSRLRYIIMPGIFPFVKGALTLSLGMCWKSGVAAEVIGQPLKSIGNNLYLSKIYLDTAQLFAWTFVIIIISFAFEKVFLFLFALLDPAKKAKGRVQAQIPSEPVQPGKDGD